MSARDSGAATAEAILGRLLVTLPTAVAASDQGVEIHALARELGVDPQRLLEDLGEVYERGYYLHAGLGDQITMAMDAERVRIWTTGEFRRPVRLTTNEALALELGMRMVGPDDATRALSHRLLDTLRGQGVPAAGPDAAGHRDSPAPKKIGVPAPDTLGDPVRSTLEEALRGAKGLELRYRPAGREVETRHLLPGLLVHAEGNWYLVGRDLDREAPRIFRCDRILEARPLPDDAPFHPLAPLSEAERDGFEGFLGQGRVFMVPEAGAREPGPGDPEGGAEEDRDPSTAPVVARVRYDADIAPWIREHGYEDVVEEPGGSLVVTHRVYGEDWLVRHVMYYAGSAELIEPSSVRSRLVTLAGQLLDREG